jgi:ElaB/YqjD/DUF883 family membrane-anchored ribosome-binding protein
VATESQRIRTEIDATREELASDLDRLADRTNPKRIVNRRWESVKSKVEDVKDRVMGASHDVADTTSQMSDTVRETPDMIARRTRGNPLAAGVIAFGAGLLVASLLAETDAERRLGQQVSDHAGELTEPLKEVGRELGAEIGGTVKEASAEVGATARQAASHTAQRVRETTS